MERLLQGDVENAPSRTNIFSKTRFWSSVSDDSDIKGDKEANSTSPLAKTTLSLQERQAKFENSNLDSAKSSTANVPRTHVNIRERTTFWDNASDETGSKSHGWSLAAPCKSFTNVMQRANHFDQVSDETILKQKMARMKDRDLELQRYSKLAASHSQCLLKGLKLKVKNGYVTYPLNQLAATITFLQMLHD